MRAHIILRRAAFHFARGVLAPGLPYKRSGGVIAGEEDMSVGIAFGRGGSLAALGAAALVLVLGAIPAGSAEKDLTDIQ